jgi:hypothetical protein
MKNNIFDIDWKSFIHRFNFTCRWSKLIKDACDILRFQNGKVCWHFSCHFWTLFWLMYWGNKYGRGQPSMQMVSQNAFCLCLGAYCDSFCFTAAHYNSMIIFWCLSHVSGFGRENVSKILIFSAVNFLPYHRVTWNLSYESLWHFWKWWFTNVVMKIEITPITLQNDKQSFHKFLFRNHQNNRTR